MLRTVCATRYVTPLREGGSMPAIVEADDLGLYVLKFRGAGQGPLALVAEIIAGAIARLLGLNVPELVLITIDENFGRNEPDEEIRDLIRRSPGLNLGLDYLPGSVMFDPAAGDRPTPREASRAVWFDSFVTNVDRTSRNPNLLLWHKALYLIDHGAALYFHHDWPSAERVAQSPFPLIREHILLRWASAIDEADEQLAPLLTADALTQIVAMVPESWLAPEDRGRYEKFFGQRLAAARTFTKEAIRARALLV